MGGGTQNKTGKDFEIRIGRSVKADSFFRGGGRQFGRG